MKKDCQRAGDEIDEPHVDEDVACDVCGRYGACQVGDRKLCPDCYSGIGSCCPEFGKDDLWTFPDKD